MRRALALCLLVVLAAAFAGCGGCGDDGDDKPPSTAASTPDRAAADKPGTKGAEDPAAGPGKNASKGQSSKKENGSSGSQGGSSGTVDLSTDPDKLPGAIVTGTGAVQTLPPDAQDHETAQRNSYSSIKAFGEEVSGEEATEITFALAQFLTAKAEGDWATACARLYSPLRQQFEELASKANDPDTRNAGCTAAFGAVMGRSAPSTRAEAAKIDVSSIRRGEGNRAFVIYKTPRTLSADMPMYLDGGIWTVGAVEAYTLRPEQAG